MTAPNLGNRVVFPTTDAAEVLPLYLEPGDCRITGRTSAHIPAGSALSLATYFNSFPAGYWRHWTSADAVRLEINLDSPAAIAVWRSDAAGRAELFASATTFAATFDLPIGPEFEDGGLYWFVIEAPQGRPVEMHNAQWVVASPVDPGTLSIGITTFNRPSYCLNQLRIIASEPELLAALDVVYVVDQGTQLLSDEPDFAEVSRSLGPKLEIIRQANLGGSGGFSRSMAETLQAGSSRYVLLLDDDAICEPEAIRRAVGFADAAGAKQPILVGGAMFRLDHRTVMFVQGEVINLDQGRPAAVPGVGYDNDFAETPLRDNHKLHRRHDAGYNGWWMTLIPTAVIAEHGLGLPYFLKWDDMEYGLRCSRAGIPTVSLPGAAVWHQSWDDKFSWRSWEEYFAERNMWLTTLAYEPAPRGIPKRSLMVDIGMLLSLQYSSVALRNAARRDALGGFADLHRVLPTRLGEVRDLRTSYRDATKRPEAGDFPAITSAGHTTSANAKSADPEIRSLGDVLLAGAVAARHLLVPVPASARRAPQVELPGRNAIWRQFGRIDSALVRYPDGYVWLVRDMRLTWSLLTESVRTIGRLWRHWPDLHRTLSAERPAVSLETSWRAAFRPSDGK